MKTCYVAKKEMRIRIREWRWRNIPENRNSTVLHAMSNQNQWNMEWKMGYGQLGVSPFLVAFRYQYVARPNFRPSLSRSRPWS